MISSFLDGFSGKLIFLFWWFSHLFERLSQAAAGDMSLRAGRFVLCLRQGPTPSRSACLEEEEVGSTAGRPQVRGDTEREEGFPGEKVLLPNTRFSSSMKVMVKVKSLSHVRLSATPWTVAYQASRSMGFSRQEYWSGLQFPSPGDLPDAGIEPKSPALEADALTSEPPGKPSSIGDTFYMFSMTWELVRSSGKHWKPSCPVCHKGEKIPQGEWNS